MFDLVFGILDVKNGSKTPRRVLVVGDSPESCSYVATFLSLVHDFETILLEINDDFKPGTAENVALDTLSTEHSLVVLVPLDCVIAEIRRRNWYRGHIWDFFTPQTGKTCDIADSQVTKILGVHVVIYVTSYAECRKGLSRANIFYDLNCPSPAFKFLVVDMSVGVEADNLDAEAELMRFIDSHSSVRVYKLNLKDEVRSKYLCKSILDEVIYNISNAGCT